MSVVNEPPSNLVPFAERMPAQPEHEVVWLSGTFAVYRDLSTEGLREATDDELITSRDALIALAGAVSIEITRRNNHSVLDRISEKIGKAEPQEEQRPAQIVQLRPEISLDQWNVSDGVKTVNAWAFCDTLLKQGNINSTEAASRLCLTAPQFSSLLFHRKAQITQRLREAGYEMVSSVQDGHRTYFAVPVGTGESFIEEQRLERKRRESRDYKQKRREKLGQAVEELAPELFETMLGASAEWTPVQIKEFFADHGIRLGWNQINQMVYPRLSALASTSDLMLINGYEHKHRVLRLVASQA